MPFPLTFTNVMTLVSCVFGLFGPVIAVSMLIRIVQRRRRGVRDTAVVVAVHPGYRCRYLEIAFVTSAGRPVRTVLDEAGPYAGYRPGHRVAVLYDPRDPESVELPSRLGVRILLMAGAFVCGPFGAFGIVHLFLFGTAFGR